MKKYFIKNTIIIVLGVFIIMSCMTYSFFYEPLVDEIGNIPASINNVVNTNKKLIINNLSRGSLTTVNSVQLDGPRITNDEIITLDAFINNGEYIEYSFDVVNNSNKDIIINRFNMNVLKNNIDVKEEFEINIMDNEYKNSNITVLANETKTIKISIKSNSNNDLNELYNFILNIIYN